MSAFSVHSSSGPVAWRHRLAAVAVIGAALAALLTITAAPALAARGHIFKETFGAPGHGPGQLEAPAGVAVNEESGDVYVADQGNHRVQAFSAAGAFLFAFGGEVNATKVALREEQVANSEPVTVTAQEENLCTAASGNECLPGTLGVGPGQFESPEQIAIDNAPASESHGDIYVTDAVRHIVEKFNATGEYLGQIDGPGAEPFPGHLYGVATSEDGSVWIDFGSGVAAQLDHFDNHQSNALLSTTEFGEAANAFTVSGLAVDSNQNSYALSTLARTGPEQGEFRVTKRGPTGRVVAEELIHENSTAVAIEATSQDLYVDSGMALVRLDPTGAEVERLSATSLTAGNGVAVDASSQTIYAADASGLIDVFVSEPPSVPTINAVSASAVSTTAAKLQAEVSPHGAATEYNFEYGPCPSAAGCATSPFPFSSEPSTLPPDFAVHPVEAVITGLLPETAYHFRVSAESEVGPAKSTDGGLTTQSGVPFALPDLREWELVSPPDKRGANLEPIAEMGAVQAAADGDAMTYLATAPTEPAPPGNSNSVQVFSGLGAEGWRSHDIALPHDVPAGASVGAGFEYRTFSADLSQGLVQPFGPFTPSTSPQATEQTPYLSTNYAGGEPASPCMSFCYRPLLTSAPGLADVPSGTEFGDCTTPPERTPCGPTLEGATEDLGSIVVESEVGLTETAGDDGGLYEFSAAASPTQAIRLVSVLPGGAPVPLEARPTLGSLEGQRAGRAPTAISSDGSRVVWSERSGEHHLYLRDLGRGETVQLDTVEGGSGEGLVSPRFQFASSDGGRILFTDQQQLTSDAAAHGADLYRCEIVENAGQLSCALTDLTPALPGESAEVLGSIVGSTSNASKVFLVANGKLTNDAVAGGCIGSEGESASPSCNLYEITADAPPKLIAVLSNQDYPDWGGARGALSKQTARISPDGRWLAFMSERPLTGYDNRDVATGGRDEEVFLYETVGGKLSCASCNPTGARPVGALSSTLTSGDGGLIGGDRTWPETQGIAANVPAWTPFVAEGAVYQSRYLSDSGRLFFNSVDPLVAQDNNGKADVYEYEPPNVGNCTEAGSTFAPSSGGCVDLISSGTSSQESGFLDASENGNDVFFLTSGRLSRLDTDNARDVYDAHVCAGPTPCLPEPAAAPTPCSGEGCQGVSSAPVEPAAQSEAFVGDGNQRACPAGKFKKGARCVKRPQKKSKGKKHHKRKTAKKHHRNKRAGSRRGGQK